MASSSSSTKTPSATVTAASNGSEGAWIGIDFGTSNCSCAVWDSTRGRPKMLQLKGLARPRKGKEGRVVPSVVQFMNDDNNSNKEDECTVGMKALERLEENCEISKAFVTSVKRLIGVDASAEDEHFLQSLPFDIIVNTTDGQILLGIQPLGSSALTEVTPLRVVVIILEALREAANQYLRRSIPKKSMRIPGSSPLANNCVIGVPAQFGHSQRQFIQQAARLAGFGGHVSTITESTAASMAYGLFVSTPTTKHAMVVDIGGGTTDITVVRIQPPGGDSTFRVVVACGDQRLGGDDMDEALLCAVLHKTNKITLKEISKQQKRSLLLSCRKGKETLCGTDEDPSADACTIQFETSRIDVSQDEFHEAIDPLLNRLRELVRTACQRCSSPIDEVVLVGGATRVPAVRRLLQKEFPQIPELCQSLDPEGAVAQGAAIQAAIKSGLVPLSELKSALMLDALPHTIGVLRGDDKSYTPILLKDAPLPAMGCATFTLADSSQPGVTVVAVEDTGDGVLEEIGEFTFLLRKLKQQKEGTRQVDIGMTMETSGKFIVSIFDENDPEHVRKKRRYQQRQQGNGGELGFFDNDIAEDEGVPKVLVIACVALFCMYLVVKIAFNEISPPELQVEVDEYGVTKL